MNISMVTKIKMLKKKKKKLSTQKADKEVTLPKYIIGISLSRYRMWL